MKKQVWFWQLIISPHMINVAIELAKLGVEVHYVASEIMCDERAKLGWNQSLPEQINIHIHILGQKSYQDLLSLSHEHTIHILQGIRGNGYVTELMHMFHAQNKQFWIIMETVKLIGLTKFIKPYIYKYLFHKYKKNIRGILAIGHTTEQWIRQIGHFSANNVYPFAYFLKESQLTTAFSPSEDKFVFVYVGALREKKRPILLAQALSQFPINKQEKISLWFIGDGESKQDIQALVANTKMEVTFFGNIPIEEVRQYLSQADCLVLPSLHDGWGAVTTEALIEGTPVICSDACGSAGTIIDSQHGGVFATSDSEKFSQLLNQQFNLGKIKPDTRNALKKWAQSLTAQAGAKYLFTILFTGNKDAPPWKKYHEHES